MRKTDKSNSTENSLHRFAVVGIGASAGGLEAFKQLIGGLSVNPGMAFLLMQHLDPSYETALSSILQKETNLLVHDLTEEIQLHPDNIYVVPSNKLLVVEEGNMRLVNRPKDSHPLYSIDIFFSALAEMYRENAIGILLSGMGTDGSIGLKAIKDNDGVTFVQAPQSAKFPAMPQNAINNDVVDFVLDVKAIPEQLLKIENTLRSLPLVNEEIDFNAADDKCFKQILVLLRLRRDVDFTYYKQTTIRRRILRRMVVNKIEAVSDYLKMLEGSVTEQDTLYQDLLIPVTSFFRDTVIFDNLCLKVFPDLLDSKNATTPIRIWVAGCSTGEEAYSIAICMHEYLGDSIAGLKVQLFATDISERAIQKARTGLYTKREMESVGPKRLAQYFTKLDGSYLIKKSIRDLCVFATHNLLKDPPFAKMDMISCRNVLIYMESYLQRKAMSTFHYALNDKGVLLLGKSETAGSGSELFSILAKQDKLYVKKTLTGRSMRLLPERAEKNLRQVSDTRQQSIDRKEDFHKNADDILLAKYTPAGVVVNEQFEIVHFRGSTGAFLEAAPGKASLNILKMTRDGLSFEIRNALHKAKETKDIIIKKGIPLQHGKKIVSIEIVPLLQTIEPYYLILFKEEVPAREGSNEPGAGKQTNDAELKRIKQLEKDLVQLREDMHAVTEDQEAANEELQSANEELLSSSEELQSMNEELETSKEELMSTNEELMTVNQELYERNEQYNQSRLYAEAIINTIREPLLVLNRDLRIKSANPSFYQTFRLTDDEIVGRILFELQESKWDLPDLRTQLLKIQTGQLQQVEWEVNFTVPDLGERVLFLNARPVKPENSEQIILLAFEDITLQKKEALKLIDSAEEMRKELRLMENFFLEVPALFCILKGADHVFEFANPRYVVVSGGEELKGKTFAQAFPELTNEGYLEILDQVYDSGEAYIGKEMKATHFPGKRNFEETYVDISCQPYRNDEGQVEGVLFFSYEVTEQVLSRREVEKNANSLEQVIGERTFMLRTVNESLKHSNKNLQEFVSIASHDLQEPLRKIKTFISILYERHVASLNSDALLLLSKTNDAANRMSALITDVLSYSRISHPDDTFILTDLNIILSNVIADFDLSIEEKEATVETDKKLPLIEAVPIQMNQLFYNLLGNALKFSRREVAPVISISGKPLANEVVVGQYPQLSGTHSYYQIVFKDNGIGFNQQFGEQIFSIFERLNSSDQYEGTGIGLALCREIITKHHGVIRAEGKENEGATFYIILPMVQTGH